MKEEEGEEEEEEDRNIVAAACLADGSDIGESGPASTGAGSIMEL